MSLDIDWSLLDGALTAHLVGRLNAILSTTRLPDVLGPISVQACDLGDEPPELTIASIQDVWPDFLDQSDDEGEEEELQAILDPRPIAVMPQSKANVLARPRTSSENSGPIWPPWPGRPASTATATGIGLGYARLRPSWSGGPGSGPGFSGPGSVASAPLSGLGNTYVPSESGSEQPRLLPRPPAPWPTSRTPPEPTQESLNAQVISHLRWRSTSMRLELRTSLLVNEPCPAFMELPLVLTVTGLVLDAGLVLAFDQEHHEAHVSLIDAAQVEAAAKTSVPPVPATGPLRRRPSSVSGAPDTRLPTGEGDGDGDVVPTEPVRKAQLRRCPPPLPPPADPLGPPSTSQNVAGSARSALGQRFIPFLVLESSVGDDRNHKHVLRNVGKVEQFVIQLVRGLVVDEVRPAPRPL